MKTKNLLRLIILALFISIPLSVFSQEQKKDTKHRTEAYAENVHMHIVIEALKLLKDKFPNTNFSDFDYRIGSMHTTGGQFQWSSGTVTSGAYQEDHSDVVYDIRGPGNFFVSNSHFWNADNRDDGDHSLSSLGGIPGEWPNAYTKACRYVDGNWHSWATGLRRYIEWATPSHQYYYRMSYHQRGLFGENGFFRTRKIWVEDLNSYFLGQSVGIHEEQTLRDLAYNQIVWEILGRMCHLLQDMTVPAHVHNDAHPPFLNTDCYHEYVDEHYLSYTWYTAKNHGGFIDPYDVNNEGNPLRYLMYTANQLADHWPSSEHCGSIPQQCAGNNNTPGGSYPMIADYYQELGGSPQYISDPAAVADYCMNHAIRATAGMLYWFAIETRMISNDPSSFPIIENVTCTSPDLSVYRGETIKFTAYPNNPNYIYTWRAIYCDDRDCDHTPNGMNMPQNGNQLTVQNYNYQTVTCTQVCPGADFTPDNLNFKVEVTARLGNNTKTFLYPPANDQRKVIPVSENRVWGCPYVYVQNDSGQFIWDNNILHRSEFDENIGFDISDKYLLNIKPGVFDNKISMNLFESSHDISSINSIKLLAVDHLIGTKIGITENNDIVMYFDEDAESPKNAEKNHIENITSLVQYNTGNGNRHDTVSGVPTDDIINEFDVPTLRRKLLSSRDKFSRIKNGSFRGSSDSTALIMKIGLNPDLDRPPTWTPVAKRPAGNITLTSDANVTTTQFARRESPSLVIIPFGGGNTSIEKADISWERDFAMYYAVVVDVFYSGFDVTELPLSEALNSANYNLLEDLQNVDGYFATLDTTGIIMLKFDDVANNSGMIRDYVLVTDGQYAASTPPQRTASMISGLKNKQSDDLLGFSNKLNANFPNPFNPTTKINYQIKRDGFVSLKIYNVIGQLVKELVGEFKNAGNYMVEFNGSHLSSGTYYYRIESNDFVETKKMILIK